MSLVKQRPGAKPGQFSGQKRKAEHELSSNPLTKKVRERIDKMTPVEKRIEDAKTADRAAVRRAINKLKKKEEWINANAEERSRLEDATRQQTMDSRIQDGRAATCVATKLGYTEQALAATWDDGNTAWEEEEETDEVVLDMRYRQDDIDSFGVEALPPDVPKSLVKQVYAEAQKTWMKRAEEHAWFWWARHWIDSINALRKKIAQLEIMPTEKILQQTPHQYFSPEDKACIRTLHCAYHAKWVTLPGPPDWWPDDYDFVKYGFVPKRESKEQIQGRLRALEMVFADRVPAGFNDLSLSNEELMVLDPLPKHFIN